MARDSEGPDYRVRFGATVSAVAGAFRFAAPAILIAWAVHATLHAAPLLLEAIHVTVPQLPFGPKGWSINLPVSAASAVVSGLLIRMLLIRSPQVLRLDRRLAAYVGLLVVAVVAASLARFAILPQPQATGSVEQAALAIASSVVGLLFELVYACLALWPIGLLVGDRLTPGQAIARMRQALLPYLGFYILLGVPVGVLVAARLALSGGRPMQMTERVIYAAAGSFVTTLAFVLLAQIYSRRIRGCDLGEDPPGALADVFE